MQTQQKIEWKDKNQIIIYICIILLFLYYYLFLFKEQTPKPGKYKPEIISYNTTHAEHKNIFDSKSLPFNPEEKKLSLNDCRSILNQEGNLYSNEEILILRDWLYRFADISLESFEEKNKTIPKI